VGEVSIWFGHESPDHPAVQRRSPVGDGSPGPIVAPLLPVPIKTKYVNMADVTVSTPSARSPAAGPDAGASGAPAFDLIELLFFAYRDFIGDADEMLAGIGFGRAHHRVLHFVNRHPGMRVADLLEILRITKQSLGRVLRELVSDGYVIQKAGPADRRQRLLYLTGKGEALARDLARLQTRRFSRALAECGPGARDAARRFLAAMVDPDAREQVERLIARADRADRSQPR
jgi:DNA-binding MarR family transcriptional regulator